ncbi:trypsin-like peptidase domain-containing protein [Thermodesulfobacteriota bacterium]
MIRKRAIMIVVLLMLPMIVNLNAFCGKLYKWVDESGVIHYSDRKPKAPENIKGVLEEGELRESNPGKPVKDMEEKPLPKNPIARGLNATFTIKGAKGLGTGFFISSDGYAVSSKHVVEGNWDLTAVMNNQKSYPISVISLSHKFDLALLLIPLPGSIPFLEVRHPKSLAPGERLLAIGASAGLHATITDGIYTGLRKLKSTGEFVLQFSAPINQGNSGGPLIDEKGRLVGIVTWKYMSKGGIPVAGVGFALPSNLLTEEYRTYLP